MSVVSWNRVFSEVESTFSKQYGLIWRGCAVYKWYQVRYLYWIRYRKVGCNWLSKVSIRCQVYVVKLPEPRQYFLYLNYVDFCSFFSDQFDRSLASGNSDKSQTWLKWSSCEAANYLQDISKLWKRDKWRNMFVKSNYLPIQFDFVWYYLWFFQFGCSTIALSWTSG